MGGIAYPGWGMDSEIYIQHNPRHNADQDYGEIFEEDDSNIFIPFEKKVASLKRSKSLEELKDNYYKLARKLHPDKGGSHEDFIQLQKDYEDAQKLL
tara:strand:- start:286 stop:576 length:291 start_codon:yes stop_codon:yes gene_type:complete